MNPEIFSKKHIDEKNCGPRNKFKKNEHIRPYIKGISQFFPTVKACWAIFDSVMICNDDFKIKHGSDAYQQIVITKQLVPENL